MPSLARLFVVLGLLFLAIGGLLFLFGKLNLPLGRLPGDIRIQTGNVTCIFPLATSILLSILLTLGLAILSRFMNK